jgi:hypothetical protein
MSQSVQNVEADNPCAILLQATLQTFAIFNFIYFCCLAVQLLRNFEQQQCRPRMYRKSMMLLQCTPAHNK